MRKMNGDKKDWWIGDAIFIISHLILIISLAPAIFNVNSRKNHCRLVSDVNYSRDSTTPQNWRLKVYTIFLHSKLLNSIF
jgi:hypothetical protein